MTQPQPVSPTGSDPAAVSTAESTSALTTQRWPATSDQTTDDGCNHHPLALDSDGEGIWGWIDRQSTAVAQWLNPILIKEARQSLKSRQFLVTFFLLLIASCVWTILGTVLNAPDVYYVPAGESLLAGYYFVLAIPLIGMVPLAAHRSLAAEIDDDTFEMLVITRLSASRIVMGKLHSAMLQMMIYFAAIVPCLAFSYLLRGVNLPTIALLLVIVFFTAMITTSAALLMGTLASNRAGQTLALLGVLGLIVLAEFICGAFCLEAVLFHDVASDWGAIGFTAITVLIGTSCIVIFLKAAAARIAPVTENRSTRLRWCMLAQQYLWVAAIAGLALWYDESEVIKFGMMILAGYWLLMGSLMMSESAELSPRVQRGLPSTLAGRSLLTWLNPGPSTGYVFAITNGTVAIGTLAVLAMEVTHRYATPPLVFAMIATGYLMAYLSVIRLLMMPISRRWGSSLTLSIGALAVVMATAGLAPTILSVLLSGAPPRSYTPLEAIDWAWTLVEAFDNNYNPFLAALILAAGLMLTLINLTLLYRVFQYRRISVPQRVLQDQTS